MIFVCAMADTKSTCKNLSNSPIIHKWGSWGTRELQTLRLSRCPLDIQVPVLKGIQIHTEISSKRGPLHEPSSFNGTFYLTIEKSMGMGNLY